ncbi:MAG TPA: hypothetical protein VKV41_07505, partial [Methylomirabilota bacterium]|nr:hypothetical protein [Methylomirabilota bacterium]
GRQAIEELEAITEEFGSVVSKLQRVDPQTYLDAMPADEHSRTIARRLEETLRTVWDDISTGVVRIQKAIDAVSEAIFAVAGPTPTEADRVGIIAARDALVNLCEMPGMLLQQLRMVRDLRKVIDARVQEDAARAVAAHAKEELDRLPEDRTAIVRRLIGR